MRHFISLSYAGARYCGWQIQPNAPSVEAEVERALSLLLGTETDVCGAGRTDTGVNAVNYIAHFDTDRPERIRDTGRFLYKLNAILPDDIAASHIGPVDPQAHARFDAVSRRYLYFVHLVKDPFASPFSFQCKFDLDFEAMNRAAAQLAGTRDFSCFEKVNGGNTTSVCTLTEARWSPYTPHLLSRSRADAEDSGARFLPDCGKYPYFVFSIRANRFLRNMVRAVVGSLIEIGRGKRSEEWILEVLASGDRSAAGQSVPGHALFLEDIRYPYALPWEQETPDAPRQ